MNTKGNIVLLEDEDHLRQGIRLNLEAENLQVEEFADASSALAGIQKGAQFDLGIFDIMLPGEMDGLELCRLLREQNHNFPIIFLTARNRLEDKLEGFASGGDDYLTKPFELEELLARVMARLKRNGTIQTGSPIQRIGAWELDLAGEAGAARPHAGDSREVVRLNLKETAILKLLLEHRGTPVSRDKILDRVWGGDEYPSNRTVDNHILRFRKIFEPDPANPKFFITRHGLGYELARE